MSQAEIILLVIAIFVIALVVGNVVFQTIAERKNPPIGKFVDHDGLRLHYIDRGDPDAPCVVLFHGNGTMIQDLTISGLVDLLAQNNRVICFDRPGFGHSQRSRSRIWTATAQADLFAQVLVKLGVHNPAVFGHSWGTLVAIALAMRGDYQVRGLVLASGYYFPTVRFDAWMMSGPAIPIFGDFLRYTIAPIISWVMLPGLFKKLFAPRSIPDAFKNEFPTSLVLRPKQLRASAEESALLIPVTAQFQSQYASIGCPVHIFHGRQDRVIESDQSRQLDKVLRHSVLHLINEGGHMITHTEPHGVIQMVAALDDYPKLHQAKRPTAI